MSIVSEIIKGKKILLFDGHCYLCNGSVKFILKHEKKAEIFFTPLQSEIGKAILALYQIDSKVTDSLIFIENESIYIRSKAALKLTRYLKGAYPLLYGFIIFPSFISDGVYNLIAKKRYQWFGRSESCMIPDQSYQGRFL